MVETGPSYKRHHQDAYYFEVLKDALRGDHEAVRELLHQFLESLEKEEKQYRPVQIFVCDAISRILNDCDPTVAFRLKNKPHRPTGTGRSRLEVAAAVLYLEKKENLTRTQAKERASEQKAINLRSVESALQECKDDVAILSISELAALADL